jgi:hypothetical protein
MSPWVLSPAAVSSNACRAYACCETKQIGARRRDAILINAGADPSHDGNALSAYSPPQNHRCMGRFVHRFLFSAAFERGMAIVRRISHLVARLMEQGATDRPRAR